MSSLGRLLAFTDGVFAIAITLLMVGIGVPRGLSTADLSKALHDDVVPELAIAALTFAVIGLFWLSHRSLFGYLQASDSRLLLLGLTFLAPITVLPFTTELLGRYGQSTTAVVWYASNVCVTAVLETAMWAYVIRTPKLLRYAPHPLMRVGAIHSAAAVVVFGGSIPVAFVSPTVAQLCWLGFPAIRLVRSRIRRTERQSARPEPHRG